MTRIPYRIISCVPRISRPTNFASHVRLTMNTARGGAPAQFAPAEGRRRHHRRLSIIRAPVCIAVITVVAPPSLGTLERSLLLLINHDDFRGPTNDARGDVTATNCSIDSIENANLPQLRASLSFLPIKNGGQRSSRFSKNRKFTRDLPKKFFGRIEWDRAIAATSRDSRALLLHRRRVAARCTRRCSRRRGESYLGVGLQPGRTDGATGFTRRSRSPRLSARFRRESSRGKGSATFPTFVKRNAISRGG